MNTTLSIRYSRQIIRANQMNHTRSEMVNSFHTRCNQAVDILGWKPTIQIQIFHSSFDI